MKIKDLLGIDYILLLAVIFLVIMGVLFIYSSGVNTEGIPVSSEYVRQIVWASAGLLVVIALSLINYRRAYGLSFWFYIGALSILVITLAMGRIFQMGSPRWIRLGSFGFQASEFAKLTTIVFLAWYLDHTKRNPNYFIRFLFSCFIVFIPMGLVLIQPDLGTSLVFIPILLGMSFIAGISLRYIIFLIMAIVLTSLFLLLPLWQSVIMQNSIPFLMVFTNNRFIAASCLALLLIIAIALFGYLKYHKSYFYWICYTSAAFIVSLGTSFGAQMILREYQLMRLIIFMDPNVDPRGSGWHIIQSITAIGSGGVVGRGFLQGTQSQYHFLPEQSTDFIFSILSEEWGFRGGIIVFALFLLVLLRLLRIMKIGTDNFGTYIVAGLVSMYGFHFFINVGMTMGIMPITGIPLMFVSYGGSALMTAMIGIGLAMSVHVRRHQRYEYGLY